MNELPTSVSAETMASVAELSKVRLRALAGQGVIERSGRGQYALLPSVRGLLAYYRRGDDVEGGLDPSQEKAKLDKLKQVEAGIRIKKARGQLVESVEVEALFAGLVHVVVRNLETLPDRLERDTGLTGTQVQMVQDSIDAARDRLYREMKDAAK